MFWPLLRRAPDQNKYRVYSNAYGVEGRTSAHDGANQQPSQACEVRRTLFEYCCICVRACAELGCSIGKRRRSGLEVAAMALYLPPGRQASPLKRGRFCRHLLRVWEVTTLKHRPRAVVRRLR